MSDQAPGKSEFWTRTFLTALSGPMAREGLGGAAARVEDAIVCADHAEIVLAKARIAELEAAVEARKVALDAITPGMLFKSGFEVREVALVSPDGKIHFTNGDYVDVGDLHDIFEPVEIEAGKSTGGAAFAHARREEAHLYIGSLCDLMRRAAWIYERAVDALAGEGGAS